MDEMEHGPGTQSTKNIKLVVLAFFFAVFALCCAAVNPVTSWPRDIGKAGENRIVEDSKNYCLLKADAYTLGDKIADAQLLNGNPLLGAQECSYFKVSVTPEESYVFDMNVCATGEKRTKLLAGERVDLYGQVVGWAEYNNQDNGVEFYGYCLKDTGESALVRNLTCLCFACGALVCAWYGYRLSKQGDSRKSALQPY